MFIQYVHIELLTLTWIEPRINGLGLNSREEFSGLYL